MTYVSEAQDQSDIIDAAVLDGKQSNRSDILREGELRALLYKSHPLVSDSQRLPTVTVMEVFAKVRAAVVHRMPTIFYAPGRTGKSRTKTIIKDLLKKYHPEIPVGVINAKYHERRSEAVFWTDAMADFKLSGPTSTRTPGVLRQRVLSAIVAECAAAGATTYALLMDEIQEWGEPEFTYLRDAENLLYEVYGIALIPISFAQPAIQTVYQDLKNAKRVDLINRYLQRRTPLNGAQTVEGLSHFLNLLDDPQFDYPAKSGISFTEFFLPDLYQQGFRLFSQGSDLWAALEATTSDHMKTKVNDVGWKWICNAVRNFIYSHSSSVDISEVGGIKQWLAAIENSGFIENLFE